MDSKELTQYCALNEATLELLKMTMHEVSFIARVYDCIQDFASTIADLAGSEKTTADHVFEAVQYRNLDRPVVKVDLYGQSSPPIHEN